MKKKQEELENNAMRHFGIRELIQARLTELTKFRDDIVVDWELLNKYRIKISSKSFGYQYYLMDKGANTSGKYVQRKDEGVIALLIQNKYNARLAKAIDGEITYLKEMMKKYEEDAIPNIYSNLHPARKRFVIPVDMSDKDYIDIWQRQMFERKPIAEGRPYFETLKGEKVRSKSEAIIADTLRNRGIPYHYEKPIKLKNGVILHPDFTILNVRTRKTIYLEHLGLLDDRGYLNDALNRIEIYEDNGIVLGNNLLITCETDRKPFQRKRIDFLIDRFLI